MSGDKMVKNLKANGLNRAEAEMLRLIGAALFDLPYKPSKGVDWKAVYRELKVQAVCGIVADLLESIPDMPNDLTALWKRNILKMVYCNSGIMYTEGQICKLLCENEIPMAIIKGAASGKYYPKPYLRIMGDVDFIVKEDYIDKAKEVLLNNGYAIQMDNGRHMRFVKNYVQVEMHRRFALTDSVEDRRLDAIVFEGVFKAESQSVEEQQIYVLPEIENGLVILAHFLQHFLRSEIGLRQVIDWMMYVDRVLTDELWEAEFMTKAEEVGLKDLAIVLTRTCQLYFEGFAERAWCQTADETACHSMMRLLLDNGNFGRKRGFYNNLSIGIIANCRNPVQFFKYAQASGMINWKAAHKKSWLKPFAWFYALIRWSGIIIGRKQRDNTLVNDFRIGMDMRKVLDAIHK